MKIKNAILGVGLFLMCAATLSANPFKINENDYQQMVEKTLVSTGNNARMKKVLAKIRAGEKVYIATLGGSVTEGAGPAKPPISAPSLGCPERPIPRMEAILNRRVFQEVKLSPTQF